MRVIFFLMLFYFVPVLSYSQKVKWEQPIQSGSRESQLCIDSRNMLYISGSYSWYNEENYFNDTQLPVADYNTKFSFIVKTDTNYQIKWMKSIKSTRLFSSSAIRMDNSDCLILLGLYRENFEIDSLSITEKDNDRHTFIGKFNSNGRLLWYKTMHGDYFELLLNDMAFDQQNNIYIIGKYQSKVVFNNITSRDSILSSSVVTSFIAKYDSEGEFKWAHSLNNSNQLNLESIKVDNKKNIYVTGWCYGKYYFNNDSIDAYNSDIILVKYDSSRNVLWYKQLGIKSNTIQESGYSVCLDNKCENIYVTGSILGNNDKNIFLSKYSCNGNLKWIRYSGNWSGASSTVESGRKVIVDKNDFVYLTGDFLYTGIFGDTTIYAYDNASNSNLYEDIFVAKYYSNGDLSWVTHAGHEDEKDYVSSLTKDNYNSIFVAGYTYRSGARFGDFILNSKWGGAFVAKIKDKVEANKFEANTKPTAFTFTKPYDFQTIFYINGQLLINYSPVETFDYDGQKIDDIIRIRQINNIGLDTLIITSGLGIISIDSSCFKLNSDYLIEGKRTDGIDTLMATNSIHFKTPKTYTGIEERFFDSVDIYPNPFSESFFIKWGKPRLVRISLYNGYGIKLLDTYSKDDFIKIIIPNYLPGIYFIKLDFDRHSKIYKAIKK